MNARPSSRLGRSTTTPATHPANERFTLRRDRLLLLSICIVALVLRLIVVWQCADASLFSDMQEYYDRARYLVDHGQFVPDAFRPPAYPVFLAAVVMIFDDRTLIAARLLQVLFGVASVGLTYLLGERVAGRRAGLIAAAIVAVYPAWLIYPVYLVSEPLYTFLTLLGLWLWTLGGAWTAILAGLVLSIAMQTRAVGVATVAGIALASLIALVLHARGATHEPQKDEIAWTPQVSRLALMLVTFAIVLAPWVVRNARLFGELIPTDTASGWNFILGNNPLATGRLELDHIPIVAKTYWSRATTDVQRHKIGVEAGMAYIRSHPGPWSILALRKIGYLVGLEGREHAWTYSHHYHGRRSFVTVWAWGLALLVTFPPLMLAALAGMFRPGFAVTPIGMTLMAILGFVVLVHVGSFGESRFHLPWMPVLAIIASTRWVSPGRIPWSWPRRTLFAAFALALVVLWIVQAPGFLETLAVLARATGPIGLPY